MKSWIFKGLAYAATAGAAATTVLLTVSSVGLKKSKSDSFPSLSGLIQDRPDVVENLLEPQKAPEPPKPPQPPPPPPPGTPGPSQEPQPPAGAKKPDAGDDQGSPGQQPSGPAGGGPQGGVPGGAFGGISCDGDKAETLDKIKQSLSTLADIFANMDQKAQSIVSCLDVLKQQALTTQPQPLIQGGDA